MLKLRQILFFRCKKISQANSITKNNEKNIKHQVLKSLRFKQVMSRICVVFILISSSTFAAAFSINEGDKLSDAPANRKSHSRSAIIPPQTVGYPTHFGSSPFLFSDMFSVTGDVVVNDKDSSTLDSYLYRSGSEPEVKIPLNISRYIGDKNKLLRNGLLSKHATIIFPSYDVDSQTAPVIDCDGDEIPDQLRPEVNKVYFNGELIGETKGDNNIWRMQRFSVDIDLVNFPLTPGSIAKNELSIAIDTANENVPLSSGVVGCRVWATEVDWASLQFEAASPVVLVPGLMGRTDTFEKSGYIKILEEEGLPVELIELNLGTSSFEICAGDGLSMFNQAEVLRQKVSEIAKKYGSESVNLIGHSKGGLDSRAFAHLVRSTEIPVQIGTMSGQPLYAQLKVPSIATHGSPHLGTVLADFLSLAIGVAHPSIHLLFNDLCALTTYGMEKFNQTYPVPADLRVLAIGADADKNGNGIMEDKSSTTTDEVAGHQVENPLANMWYQLNRHTESIGIEFEAVHIPFVSVQLSIPTLAHSLTMSPQPNDGMVTIASSTKLNGATAHIREIGLNHGTILSDEDTQKEVIGIGKTGFLQWSKK